MGGERGGERSAPRVVPAADEEGFEGVQVERFLGFAAGEEPADAIGRDLGGEVEVGTGERGDRDAFDEGAVLVGEGGSVQDELRLRVATGRCREVEFPARSVEQETPRASRR